jgi:hypothetical protein
MQDDRQKNFKELARTEVELHTRDPDFERSIVVDYFFEV